jgi:hypothetical protein
MFFGKELMFEMAVVEKFVRVERFKSLMEIWRWFEMWDGYL